MFDLEGMLAFAAVHRFAAVHIVFGVAALWQRWLVVFDRRGDCRRWQLVHLRCRGEAQASEEAGWRL